MAGPRINRLLEELVPAVSRCTSATRPTATRSNGPVISKSQQEQVFGFLERASGATVLTGGRRRGSRLRDRPSSPASARLTS
jgi:acyl-CoA reductase-like NAD-dependent aldehyde dehydrogenase